MSRTKFQIIKNDWSGGDVVLRIYLKEYWKYGTIRRNDYRTYFVQELSISILYSMR